MLQTDPYKQGLFEIASLYRGDKELVKSMLLKFDSPITILSEIYQILIREKEIEPIETLPEVEKEKIKSLARQRKTKRLQFCQAYYVLNII